MAVRGEKHGSAKLTDADVQEVWRLWIDGMTQKDIALVYDVSKSVIQRIITGKTWKHI